MPVIKANNRNLIRSTVHYEGFSAVPYRDSRGNWTVGYGTNLETIEIKTTTLVSILNLPFENNKLSERQARRLMIAKYEDILRKLSTSYIWFDILSEPRQRCLAEMFYQLGTLTKFPKMLRAIRKEDWERAAIEMEWTDVTKTKHSLWFQQTPKRVRHCQRLIRQPRRRGMHYYP